MKMCFHRFKSFQTPTGTSFETSWFCQLFSTDIILVNDSRAQLQKTQLFGKFTVIRDIGSTSAKCKQLRFCRGHSKNRGQRRFPAEHCVVAEDQIDQGAFALRHDVGPACIWISVDFARDKRKFYASSTPNYFPRFDAFKVTQHAFGQHIKLIKRAGALTGWAMSGWVLIAMKISSPIYWA